MPEGHLVHFIMDAVRLLDVGQARVKDQFNFTDPESRIMNTPDGFEQSDNAQAAVVIDSRLLVGVSVSDAPNDKEQLAPTLAAVSPVIESVGAVAEAEQPRGDGAGQKIYAATERQPHGRTVQELE